MLNITFSMVFSSANAWSLHSVEPLTTFIMRQGSLFLLASNHPPEGSDAGKRRCHRLRARLNCTRGWCLPLCSGCWLVLCFCHLQAQASLVRSLLLVLTIPPSVSR